MAREAAEEARREVERLKAQVEQQRAADTECANVAEIIRNTQGAPGLPKLPGAESFTKGALEADRQIGVVGTVAAAVVEPVRTEAGAPSPIPHAPSTMPSSSAAWLASPWGRPTEGAAQSTPAPSRPFGTPYTGGLLGSAALTPSNRIRLSEAANGDRLLMAPPLIEDHGGIRRQTKGGPGEEGDMHPTNQPGGGPSGYPTMMGRFFGQGGSGGLGGGDPPPPPYPFGSNNNFGGGPPSGGGGPPPGGGNGGGGDGGADPGNPGGPDGPGAHGPPPPPQRAGNPLLNSDLSTNIAKSVKMAPSRA